MIGVSKAQCEKSDVQWDPLNWSVKNLYRYWAILDLENTVEDPVTIPAYQDLLEEWGWRRGPRIRGAGYEPSTGYAWEN